MFYNHSTHLTEHYLQIRIMLLGEKPSPCHQAKYISTRILQILPSELCMCHFPSWFRKRKWHYACFQGNKKKQVRFTHFQDEKDFSLPSFNLHNFHWILNVALMWYCLKCFFTFYNTNSLQYMANS